MDLSYGIPFGKRSETVKRPGDSSAEEQEVLMGAPPEAMPVATPQPAQQSYPAFMVGLAKRQGPNVEEEPVQDVIHGMKRRKGDSFDFENIYPPLSCDHLPHPSKLRKVQHKKTVKKSHIEEKHMCIDYHLRQLRQRTKKYQLCKEQTSSPMKNTDETQVQEPDVDLNVEVENRHSTHNIPCWTPFSVSENLPHLNLPNFHRKQSTSFQQLYPTGRVLLGSASVEQLQEEERWFRKLWKPKNTSKPTEE
ncbi:uncharacterized protein LOC124136682 isoform X1 [Haliotis rufescens]|uniref:uncharacterized protein LOC124136682 isoform X1 n=1 Tax=Haliotis rufescens TaxID=6454 RepID=UPI00201F6D2C|nr:uncharacterized protein LOC124136682 isoform X1 [Haliotis rufescens]XP_046358624.2 uncharacterized protein LOC124136682 isoform X1 [Haliotis rufescens]XP_046358625.2 uncharacterized protein LOC124136682 isoform X1 [Haliotis rufescens]